ncbi:PAS domain S-box-containing protein [Pedobacter westerhofensis]|uniref:histidine kinase n=1 Tax=Pedobacter westerhofensis TaxID=425512 RepID=A0A521FUB8_9SPHI|nr:PAS domain-containing sensor histidine kinase [Pedobacter westerhofensis]SMO99825.1 PAS domain S-box-containing protein [Pedobacter westerhofensis]
MHHFEDPLFRTIFNQLPQPRLIIKASSASFTIVCTNHAWQEIAGDHINQLYGKEFRDVSEKAIVDAQLRHLIEGLLREGIQLRENIKFPEILLSHQFDNSYAKWVQLECTPITNDSSQQITYLIFTLHDITEELNNKKKLILSRQNEAELLKEQQLLNEELAATNKELGQTNKALMQSQVSLSQINRELEDRIEERTRKLQFSESRFRSLFEQAPVGMCFLTGEALIIELANQPILEIWGCQADHIIGISYQTVFPHLSDEFSYATLKEVYDRGETYTSNEIITHSATTAGSHKAYVNAIFHPLKDANGKVTGLMIILAEITDWVIARQKAEGIQDQLNLALESAELGTWYLDLETRQMISSGRLKEMFGYDPAGEMSMEQCVARMDESYRSAVLAAIEQAIKDSGRYEIEYPLSPDLEGRQRWIRATGKRFSGRDGKPDHFSGTALDITGGKLEEIRKNDFIAIASHELKTPLTSLKGYLQLMESKALLLEIPFFTKAVSRSLAQIDKMHKMIGSFLDMTRIEARSLPLNFQTFNISELLQEMAEEIKMLAPEFEISINVDQWRTVHADRDKIAQVLSNLLNNAVKYSGHGKKIHIGCSIKLQDTIFSIRDEGIGIKAHEIARLFERYYRIENKHTNMVSGFGIGLYLCAEIVRLHHGRIWVKSKLEEGSTFYFSLPRV